MRGRELLGFREEGSISWRWGNFTFQGLTNIKRGDPCPKEVWSIFVINYTSKFHVGTAEMVRKVKALVVRLW